MRQWPQARAGLIAIAIGFGLVDGCPLPPVGEPTDGMPLRALVEPARRVQRIVEWPVAWMRPVLRIAQRWAVYQAPGRDRYRMSLEGRGSDGAWRLLYRAMDPDHDEDAELVEHARVWTTWDPRSRVPSQYPAFASWITARVLTDHADFTAARIRMEKIVVYPGGFTPSGEYVATFVRGAK